MFFLNSIESKRSYLIIKQKKLIIHQEDVLNYSSIIDMDCNDFFIFYQIRIITREGQYTFNLPKSNKIKKEIKKINNHIIHLVYQRMSNPIKNRNEVIRERKKQGFLDACEYED